MLQSFSGLLVAQLREVQMRRRRRWIGRIGIGRQQRLEGLQIRLTISRYGLSMSYQLRLLDLPQL